MDFIDGTSLQELHGRFRPLPLAAIAAITVQAAEALRYAHGRPVVHRDLKPSNIMIAESGVLKVIDFGIAKNLAAGAVGHTRPGVTLGSTGYQAPEQIGGLPTSSATDVYALGCVLYELFALNPPFPDTEPAAVQRKHLQNEPCSLLASSHRVTAEIDDMILRMLAKDPKQRPDLAEVLAVFEPHLPKPGDPAPVPTLDPDPTFPYRWPDQCQDALVEARPAAAPKVAPAGRRITSPWLSVREMSAACDSAELELASGARGPGVDRLAVLAPRARKEMGSAKPVVLRAFRLLARAQEMQPEQGKEE
jgi:serine/threonine protein kinase